MTRRPLPHQQLSLGPRREWQAPIPAPTTAQLHAGWIRRQVEDWLAQQQDRDPLFRDPRNEDALAVRQHPRADIPNQPESEV
ncbi:hypothetical protein [Chitiniphilus eburneus]|uniref:hypothetical protein n=1 Tax=Chitiniphilus eburneus TaxID=2571148 RepID=UPI0035CF8D92